MKKSRKNLFLVILFIFSIAFFATLIGNLYFGWYGYEKWKYRRITYGNKIESIKRKVFVKDLDFYSNIELDSFYIYIEKGYKYGNYSSRETKLLNTSKYPYQLSYKFFDTTRIISYEITNKRKYDSIDNVTVFLEKPYLNDTLSIGVYKYISKKWDSIGYIKVWDKSKKSYQ